MKNCFENLLDHISGMLMGIFFKILFPVIVLSRCCMHPVFLGCLTHCNRVSWFHGIRMYKSFYVIVKALPRVCMKIQHEGSVEWLIQHEAKPSAAFTTRHPECCIYHETPRVLCFIHTSIGSALNGILYLTTVNWYM